MAEEDGGAGEIGLSAGIDYMSNYLWRGTEWYGGDGAFFPSVGYAIPGTGLSLGVSAELSEDYIFEGDTVTYGTTDVKDIHATDFGADYSYTFGEMVTVGASAWYYLMWKSSLSFLCMSLSVALDFLPLTPTLTYSHDIYTDSGDAKDFYIQLGIGHSFALAEGASLDLGAVAGYYYAESTSQKGVSDIDLSAGLSVERGIVTYSGGFHCVIVPGEDYRNNSRGVKDVTRFYGTFGVSCAI